MIAHEICVHKCVNIFCFYEIYEDILDKDHNIYFTSNDERDRDFNNRRSQFINCSEAKLPKEMKMKRYLRRKRLCLIKNALSLPHMEPSSQELTTFRCMSETCFNRTFQDANKNDSVILLLDHGEKIREQFMECV